jgi:hypothetical protein
MAKKANRKKPKRKAARKKPRQPVRKSPRRGASARGRRIKYRCTGSGNCSATPRAAHMSPGHVVLLEAVNTDVTITFGANGSPFVPPTNPLHISRGQTRRETVAGGAAGRHPYTLRCSTCARQGHLPPEMIVP